MTGQRRPHRRPEPSSGSVWGLLAVITFVVGFVLFAAHLADSDTPTIGALLMMVPAIGFAAVLIGRIDDREYDIRSVMYLGLATRLVGTYFRFLFPADAATYHTEGIKLAASFRSLDFLVDTGRQVPGTGALRYISGLVHVAVFDDLSAAFLVWLVFSFTGCWLMYKAFLIGLPNGDRYRYALLLFLWPSLSYWPNSIGKEGWMLLGIGLASYGGAKTFKQSARRGLPTLAVGLAICGLVRPHVGLIIVIGLTVAYVVARPTASKRGIGVKVAATAFLLVGGAILAGQTATLLKADDPLGGDISSALDTNSFRTTQGDSAFAPATVHSPVDYPKAFVTVLFRPFPNEAHDINGLLTSAETVVLFILFALSTPRLLRLPQLVRTEPYVTYALVYTLVFVFAFSSIGNFGILARQRSQLTPVLLVLVCLPATKEMLPKFGRRRRLAMDRARRAAEPRHEAAWSAGLIDLSHDGAAALDLTDHEAGPVAVLDPPDHGDPTDDRDPIDHHDLVDRPDDDPAALTDDPADLTDDPPPADLDPSAARNGVGAPQPVRHQPMTVHHPAKQRPSKRRPAKRRPHR